MTLDTEPHHRQGKAMLLVGVRQSHDIRMLATEIPKQWAAFKRQFDGFRSSQFTYGVVCGVEGGRMEYMCALEVDSFDDAPNGSGRIIVPAQKYAVFTHSGHISDIGTSWHIIMDTLVPRFGLTDAHTPSFERYGKRYNPATGKGIVEIWFPIV